MVPGPFKDCYERLGGRKRDLAALDIVHRRGKRLGEAAVHPVDHTARLRKLGTGSGLQRQVVKALLLGPDEQADIRIPEPVDRLHAVADDEQRAGGAGVVALCSAQPRVSRRTSSN